MVFNTHFSPQPFSPNLHPAKSEPFLSQVLLRGADMIYRVVDAEEAVVGCRVKYYTGNEMDGFLEANLMLICHKWIAALRSQ